MNKKCCKCGRELPITEYYKHSGMPDGYLNKCKDCAKKDARDNYRVKRNDPEFVKRDRARGRNKFHRLYKGKSNTCPNHAKNWELNNPEKKKATSKVNNAIKGGSLIKQPCEICGTTFMVHAHHEDYTKPLEVKWLCIKHHNERHVQKREEMLYQQI